MNTASIVVTGASGYIGGQTLLYLNDQGHDVFGLDLRQPPKTLSDAAQDFLVGDFVGFTAQGWLREIQPQIIIHCAGTSLVGPSLEDPEPYFNNNVVKTKTLLDFVVQELDHPRIIFSSSASVYGDPKQIPCQETHAVMPISAYGQSKAMTEWIMTSYAKSYGLDAVILRYFNACGADPKARHGQDPGATHLIARALESLRDHQPLTINGNSYLTRDGTCVRDYLHVLDIARAHELAIDRRLHPGIYNLGSGQGHSVLEIITAVKNVTGQQPETLSGSARPGDPPELRASAKKFTDACGWAPCYDLETIIKHAWEWYLR